MTSYQRRKRQIAYLEQCVTDLEERCLDLAKQLNRAGIAIEMSGRGIEGDQFLTP